MSKKAQSKAQTIVRTEQDLNSLIEQMTLDEKIGQMTLLTGVYDINKPTISNEYAEYIQEGKCGAIFNVHTADVTRELQEIAINKTRLGIPLLFGFDVIHGYKTIFPVPLGEAASWDLQAIEESARIAAEEASAAGLHWTFAPMVDIARDPRWGRIVEGAGEDAYLGSQVAQARVRGFQANLGGTNSLLACAKHFAVYGAVQAGRDYHIVDLSERTLREVYLPPFKAALDSGVATFMTSFNEINGIPSTCNRQLLTDILRGEWGFKGFIVTDYTSINELVPHGIATNEKEAGEMAINAGVDMDMEGKVFLTHLSQSIKDGKISQTTVDEAVRRILKLKFRLDLFDDPYRFSDMEREKRMILSLKNLGAARDVARRSIVLLKNEKNILPLSVADKIKTLAVIGPLADSKSELIGPWSAAGDYNDCISLLEGIKAKINAKSAETRILYSKGFDDIEGFTKAIEIANQADVVVVAIGEAAWMSGEASSRSDILLPGVQEEMVLELVKTAKPIVAVLMNGRPLAIPRIAESATAVLETWFLGTQAGNAIADVLFGDYNPSGKLPVTFPRSVGQIPLFYNMKNTGRPMDPDNKYTSKYLDVPNTPLYPFGYGLSYSAFEYGDIAVNQNEFTKDDTLEISIVLTNTSNIDGEEVVQLYVRDLVGSVTRPVKELKGFQKTFLKAGESKTIKFELTPKELAFYDIKMNYTVEPGEFEIMIGKHSEDSGAKSIKVTFSG